MELAVCFLGFLSGRGDPGFVSAGDVDRVLRPGAGGLTVDDDGGFEDAVVCVGCYEIVVSV